MTELAARIKQHRIKNGLSQDSLAQETGLNLRTIQRIENGETVPRGDTLKRLAMALKTSPDELIDWQSRDDKNVLLLLNLAQLAFLVFPIMGILLPLIIWILQKDKVRQANELGKKILNFQISWNIALFLPAGLFMILKIFHYHINIPFSIVKIYLVCLYAYNLISIIINTIALSRLKKVRYLPVIRFFA